MFDGIRTSVGRFVKFPRDRSAAGGGKRPHNLFEAAAAYVSACAEDDQDRMDEAVAWARKGVTATRGQVELHEIFFMPSAD